MSGADKDVARDKRPEPAAEPVPASGRSSFFGRLFGGGSTKQEAREPSATAERASATSERTEAETTVSADDEALPDQPDAGDRITELAGATAPGQVVAEVAAEESAPAKSGGWFSRLRDGLSKTSGKLSESITGLFTKRKLDADTLQDLEDVLIQADLGVETAMRIGDAVSDQRYQKGISPDEVRGILADEVERVLGPVAKPLQVQPDRKPHVILMVGVNGTGKTTTIGKLASRFKSQGFSVLLAAGDTFRAAAVEQLKVWGERTGCPVVTRDIGADAAGLAYDALERAQGEGIDILMIDTAGRLQNKAGLMEELAKIVRVLRKRDETAPHDVVITLDATTGQNAMNQVEEFRRIAGVTGIVMTKLDGTARGGILVAISAKHGLPVHAIGVGEGIDDLQPFDAREFARAIAAI